MARPLRIQFEDAVYHITSRGNAGQGIFLDDQDRRVLLATLGEVVERCGWICHAYCLMSNHYHLLIETPSPNLARGMQLLNGVYTQRFNRHHKRFGHVLQGRYKAILVEKESHLLELARYVVLNPVRARMVRSPRDWPWSSYRATAGELQAPDFLHVGWILAQFDARPRRAEHAYRDFVKQGRGVSVWEAVRGGSLLGSEKFVKDMRARLVEIPQDPNVLRRERHAARPSLRELFAQTESRSDRDRRIRDAVREHHYKLREVADHLGLHFTTISVIAKREASRARK